MLRYIYQTIFLLLTVTIFPLSASPTLATEEAIHPHDSLRVSLITCDPGPDVYQIFGHTAIRIVNEGEQPFDLAFNYGIFSFTDDFVFKFVKGETDYLLGVYDFKDFMIDYVQRESSVYEQVLNLTPDEKESLLNSLIINAQPQNRKYRYNFLYDNCATRPRDFINRTTHHHQEKVQWNNNKQHPSFREIIHHYGSNYSWLLFGIDLALGRELDREASWHEQMFIPLILQEACRKADITATDGTTRPLVAQEQVVFNSGSIPLLPPTPWYLSPLFTTSLLLLLTILITWHDTRHHRISRWYDTIINLLFFAMSIIIYFLIIYSEHPATTININALWITPLSILPPILLWIRKAHNTLRWYYIAHLLLLATFIVLALCNVQYINIAVYPLIALSAIRACNFIKHHKTSI